MSGVRMASFTVTYDLRFAFHATFKTQKVKTESQSIPVSKGKDRLRNIMVRTPEQLAELTDKNRPRDQIAWLTEHGCRFEISALGRPRLLMKEVEGKMLTPEIKTINRKSTAPDFATINEN